jgi:hypothetical protein
MPGRAVGRKVRDAREARGLLETWSDSGESMSDWCRTRGINWYSLSAYQGWEVRGSHGAERADGFVEVVPPETTAGPAERAASRYRVVVGARVIEVGGDFEDEVLRRLLRVVASC